VATDWSRLRPSRHDRYRVTVSGSARTESGHWVYEEVKQMCSALSAMNCDIITGGGPGLMQAAKFFTTLQSPAKRSASSIASNHPTPSQLTQLRELS
jgi:predicted Rossmann-fold nucleotide-binding protein